MARKIGIIGGGIVGATAAFYLASEPGFEVTVFDEVTGQGTSASAGIISPWLSQRRNKEWYRMVKTGAAFYPTFLKEVMDGLDIPKAVYQQVGTLLFTKKDKTLEKLLSIGIDRRKDAPEIGELRILTPDEIHAFIPIYSKDKRALYASGGARVDGQELVRLLLNRATALNTTVINEKALLQTGTNQKWRIESDSVKKEFDAIILANAAGLPEILEPLGYEVDIRPQKGQLVELQTNFNTNNWPVIMPAGEKDIIPFLDGRIVIGATHEDDAGFDLTLEEDVLKEMVENAKEQFSDSFADKDIIAGRVGTRAYTSDFAPFFGEVPGLMNVFTASGLGSTGLTAGPIVGKILSDFILGLDPVLNPDDYPIQNYVKQGEKYIE